MEKGLQHVQLPNKMTENKALEPLDVLVYLALKSHNSKTTGCFPSLKTLSDETGGAINTIRKCILNLKDAGYITTEISGRKTMYFFNKYDHFECFSYDFITSKEYTFREKAYYAASQQYMYMNSSSKTGHVGFSNTLYANKINMDRNAIVKLDKSLQQKGALEIKTCNGVTERIFDINKFGQAVVFKLKEHEEKLDKHEDEIENLKAEVLELKRQLAEQNNANSKGFVL